MDPKREVSNPKLPAAALCQLRPNSLARSEGLGAQPSPSAIAFIGNFTESARPKRIRLKSRRARSQVASRGQLQRTGLGEVSRLMMISEIGGVRRVRSLWASPTTLRSQNGRNPHLAVSKYKLLHLQRRTKCPSRWRCGEPATSCEARLPLALSTFIGRALTQAPGSTKLLCTRLKKASTKKRFRNKAECLRAPPQTLQRGLAARCRESAGNLHCEARGRLQSNPR